MIDLKRFNELQTQCGQLQRKADQAEGAAKQLRERLAKDYGCNSLEEAERVLKRKRDELAKAETHYNEQLAAFETEWADVLEEEGD